MRIFSRTSLATGTALALALGAPTAAYAQATYSFNLPAQDLGQSLRAVARRTGENIVFDPASVRGRRAPALNGSYSAAQAVERLLVGTGLEARRTSGGSWVVSLASGEAQAGGAAASSESADAGATPEILVIGSRSQNADIQRTENDAQPYVVFDAREIERSQATNVEEFLRSRLPQNTRQGSSGQTPFGVGNRSEFNLRGLGANQTLVLVDGRRMPGTFGADSSGNPAFNQPDVNGIPLAAIERIEVLPSTASGIYGGGATGGVINIIRNRDYTGLNIRATYGNTFDIEMATRSISLTAGASFEGGNSNILLVAGYSDAGTLRVRDRDFLARARQLQLTNNPAVFDSPTAVPLGSTPNIVSSNGSNLVLRDGTPLNSPRTFVPFGYAGISTDGGRALIANAGRFNFELPDDLTAGQQLLLASPTTYSISISPRRSFGPNVDAFLDLSWSRNRAETTGVPSTGPLNLAARLTLPANATNNPFTTAIRVAFPKQDLEFPVIVDDRTLRAAAGLIVRLSSRWSASVDVNWSRVRTRQTSTQSAFLPSVAQAFRNGSLGPIRDVNAFPLDYTSFLNPNPDTIVGPQFVTLVNVPLRVSGPLFDLPGGAVTMTAIAEFRREALSDSFTDLLGGGTTQALFVPGLAQSIRSGAIELRLPVISPSNSIPLIRELEVQASVRRDDYRTRSSSGVVFLSSRDDVVPQIERPVNEVGATKFTVAARYAPTTDVFFRASFGTGFLPPSIGQIYSFPAVNNIVFISDPRRGGTAPPDSVSYVFGGNAELEPEESESLSAGIVFTPRIAPGLRFSADYTRISKINEIATLTDQQIVDQEAYLPGRVVRGANLPGDQPGWAGPIIGLDTTLANIAATRIAAFDFQLDYTLRTRSAGTFRFYAVATYQSEFRRQITPAAPSVDSSGFANGPLHWRGNAGVGWTNGPIAIDLNAQYYDSYRVYSSSDAQADIDRITASQGSSRVRSQFYVDGVISYRFAQTEGAFSGVHASLGVQNIFNASPPIIATTGTFGGYSFYGDPRRRRFTFSLSKQF